MKLLHLDSSIQGDSSASRLVSAAAVERLKAIHPGLEVDYRDLAAAPLPHITLGGFATGEAVAVIEQFLAADILVIGAPMYNFGLPTQLKAWFDHILVAGRTFRYGADGVEGLAGGKRAILALSRGGIYSEGSPGAGIEHAESHLRGMLGFIGITDIESIVAEGLALGAEQREATINQALSRVEAIEVGGLSAAA
ncbi:MULTISPECIES: FMN-dependent NADH-azoreductase [unclassified Sphingomonas]|uniref:FMN-dependent NADH-azoreductase n=1 Tax=unclassified Sphingomonas TaxID=196159 RepID=UPI0006F7A1F3|nr:MULTISPECIES: NAD(P)H-dependent oxidoreductase [unclassified Sphingomonas]KQX23324.1 FMN-dependent NADH-azoreductase [Sphingomonas sp. Root1294]KQY68172.1 FMN-dependent NADH-azoreductase [Sphingomonas sp. Root50]KRB91065.1 FMN-dependent NADH-azoreductase [Sphingomonas sp. Root720]